MAIWKMIDDLKKNLKMFQNNSQLPNDSENNSVIQQNNNTESGNSDQEDNNDYQSKSETSQLSDDKEEKAREPNDSQNNTQSKKDRNNTQSSTLNKKDKIDQSSNTNAEHSQENNQSIEENKESDTEKYDLEEQPNREYEQGKKFPNIEENSDLDFDKLSISEKLKLLNKIKKIIQETKGNKSVRQDLMEDIIRKHSNSPLAKHTRYYLHNERKSYYKSYEEKYDVNNQNVKLMNKLSELPSFENRKRGPGFSFDLSSIPEASELIIRNLIEKFLKQRFIRNTSDLNKRGLSSEKTSGFYKWDTVLLSVHLKTKQLNRLLSDKYDYDYDKDGEENVPLSFYFDLSGSMNNYSSTLAVIALELLKNGIKVLVGYNERVNFQINSISENTSVEELTETIISMMSNDHEEFINKNVNAKVVNKNIDNYLIESHGEKCVVFTDFDPLKEICNLSNYCEVYWFNFEKNCSINNYDSFNGYVYDVDNLNDIAQGIERISNSRFKTLCYIKRERRR